jgi:hypothetical protein
MASVARCPSAAGCSYAFPNVVLPFIGGFLVDRIGVRKAYVFLSALLTTAQYPLPPTASDVPRSRSRTRGMRPAWSAPRGNGTRMILYGYSNGTPRVLTLCAGASSRWAARSAASLSCSSAAYCTTPLPRPHPSCRSLPPAGHDFVT